MHQPIKFLPYFTSSEEAGDSISRFKGMSLNCKAISESWELSAIPGFESIVADGPDCGMPLSGLVAKYGERLVGRNVTTRFGSTFPIVLKLYDSRQSSDKTEANSGSYGRLPIVQVNDFLIRPSSAYGSFNPMPSVSGRNSHNSFLTVCEHVDGERKLMKTCDSFMGMLCLEGWGEIRIDGISTTVKRGETLLLPAPVEEISLEGGMTLLTIFIPAIL